MMYAFKLQISLLVLVFLTSCLGYVPPASNQPSQNSNQSSYTEDALLPPQNDEDYDNGRYEDPDREEVLNKYRNQDLCESEEWDHECHISCKEMYKRNEDKEDCEALDKTIIYELYAIHELLKNPNYSSLTQSINLEYLDVYFNVSIAAFDRLIGEYSKKDAEDVLVWITEDEKVTELVADADEDYRTFSYLLETATTSFSDDELDEPFSRDIEGDDTLFEIAIGNEVAMEWFQNYIFETATQCTDGKEISIPCFTVFCQIGDSFGDDKSDKDNQEDWMNNSSNFNSYLNDIIEAGINSTNNDTGTKGTYYWGDTSNTYIEADDLENWVDDLCKVGATNDS